MQMNQTKVFILALHKPPTVGAHCRYNLLTLDCGLYKNPATWISMEFGNGDAMLCLGGDPNDNVGFLWKYIFD